MITIFIPGLITFILVVITLYSYLLLFRVISIEFIMYLIVIDLLITFDLIDY